MPTKTTSRGPHLRIVVGLPNLQEQFRMVDRLSGMASVADQTRMEDLARFLSELYTQLQHRDAVTVHRFGNRSRPKPAGAQERP